ncbi:MAG: hypothetical protein AAF602_21665 [Myxococcota bacterium]
MSRLAWLFGLAACGSPEVADCAQPRLFYAPAGETPSVHWGCRPPARAWGLLPVGFLDPLDTGWEVVGQEVDWDVVWPEEADAGDTGAAAPATAFTGSTGVVTGDTGFFPPRRRGATRNVDDTGTVGEILDATAWTGTTGVTGLTGLTGDTAEPEVEDETLLAGPTADTVDTGSPVQIEPSAPPVFEDPTDLVVPESAQRYDDPRDLVVPEEVPE